MFQLAVTYCYIEFYLYIGLCHKYIQGSGGKNKLGIHNTTHVIVYLNIAGETYPKKRMADAGIGGLLYL